MYVIKIINLSIKFRHSKLSQLIVHGIHVVNSIYLLFYINYAEFCNQIISKCVLIVENVTS
jgi:hypothetical protein